MLELSPEANGCAHEPSGHAAAGPRLGQLRELLLVSVGLRPIHDLLDEVRGIMLTEALRRSGGNIARAARLLGISRQGVQQMIQRYNPEPGMAGLRAPPGSLELARKRP
ncbi:MAG TPA: helix-turn-helix domain-containing protein [Polyangiaceae bacterium]|nr:helix-turn-helix domain-containing protein [Polyangiaceae bacterium]